MAATNAVGHRAPGTWIPSLRGSCRPQAAGRKKKCGRRRGPRPEIFLGGRDAPREPSGLGLGGWRGKRGAIIWDAESAESALSLPERPDSESKGRQGAAGLKKQQCLYQGEKQIGVSEQQGFGAGVAEKAERRQLRASGGGGGSAESRGTPVGPGAVGRTGWAQAKKPEECEGRRCCRRSVPTVRCTDAG